MVTTMSSMRSTVRSAVLNRLQRHAQHAEADVGDLHWAVRSSSLRRMRMIPVCRRGVPSPAASVASGVTDTPFNFTRRTVPASSLRLMPVVLVDHVRLAAVLPEHHHDVARCRRGRRCRASRAWRGASRGRRPGRSRRAAAPGSRPGRGVARQGQADAAIHPGHEARTVARVVRVAPARRSPRNLKPWRTKFARLKSR